jgi:phosphopentomutase
MRPVKRVVLIILDSVGVGELPDASAFGDEGSNTLANTAKAVGGLFLPHLEKLGLGNIAKIEGVEKVSDPQASFGKMAEVSAGKDTTTGHWEIAGLWLKEPFPLYPNGFPAEIIKPFEKRIGRRVLGNKPASGTEIIKELGAEHLETGWPIVYTSADSVFQIAAHERVIPVEELYRICQIARSLLTGRHKVARVIARPFVGEPGNFTRTARRKDFSLPPTGKTLLDYAQEAGINVYGVGKIGEIFAGRGLTKVVKTKDNMDGVDKLLACLKESPEGLIWANLIDFDMLWGHRNNPEGYAQGLIDFDSRLPEIMEQLTERDVLIITADHGCDPTTPSTDHSREYVPLLVYGPRLTKAINLGTRKTFADVGRSIADLLAFEAKIKGRSFASDLLIWR